MSNLTKIETAILNGKSSVKIGNQKISLPEPQKTGTETQRKGYANVAAQSICKQFKINY